MKAKSNKQIKSKTSIAISVDTYLTLGLPSTGAQLFQYKQPVLECCLCVAIETQVQ